jgi:protein ImuB
LVDVTGCERLFGGQDRLIRRAVQGLADLGFTATAAIADTPGAAWALAHADGRQSIVAPPGQVTAALAHLPVWSLRIEPDVTDKLRTVGVHNIEALLHLPRASLAGRFSERLLHRVDQVLGHIPEILTPYRPPPRVRAQVRFTGPTDRLDLLREAVDRALAVFCEQLARKVAGTRQLFVTLYFPRSGHRTVDLRISRATRHHARLWSLLLVRLENLKLSQKVEAVVVWTRQVESLDGRQELWFDTPEKNEGELADLVDRLAARLGSSAVRRAELADDHQPELAYRYKSLTESGLDQRPANENIRRPIPARPLRLLPTPVETEVMAVVPHGPPVRFRLSGADRRVTRCAGPERVETGWWRGRWICRDYYCVQSDLGCRCWLFREQITGKWYLHGFFD